MDDFARRLLDLTRDMNAPLVQAAREHQAQADKRACDAHEDEFGGDPE
jgi:hypothetical protein